MQDQITENKYRIFTKFGSALGGISDAIRNVGVLQVQEKSVRREWESKIFEAENQNTKSLDEKKKKSTKIEKKLKKLQNAAKKQLPPTPPPKK